MTNRLWTTSALAVVVMMLVGACAASTPSPTPAASVAASEPASAPAESAEASASAEPSAAPAAAVPAVPTGYTELDAALGADKPFNGKTVSVQTQWVGGEGTNFASSLADFAAATGIKINVDSIGSSHETVLRTRIEGGQPPDLAMLAQPTPVLAYAADGKVIDVATFMDPKKLADEHPATIGLVTQGSNIWGIPYKADVKSTIWYPIKAFEAAGYTVPTTWDELIALSDKIVADGSNPWCVAQAVPATRPAGRSPTGSRKSSSRPRASTSTTSGSATRSRSTRPRIKEAFDRVGQIFFTDGTSSVGRRRSSTPTRQTPMDPMFDRGPGGAEVLDAEDPDLVRPGLLPGSARKRDARRST